MDQKKIQYSRGLILVIAAVIAILAVFCYQSGILKNLELLTLDYRFLLNSATPQQSINYNFLVKKSDTDNFIEQEKTSRDAAARKIIFINMPEGGVDTGTSLKHSDCAIAIKILTLWGARAIVIPGVLSRTEGDNADEELAEAITNSNIVYLSAYYDISRNQIEDLYTGDNVSAANEPAASFRGINVGIGHINAFTDPDGKLRRAPAIIRYKGRSIYQLGLRVAFDIVGASEKDVEFDPDKHLLILRRPDQQEAVIPLQQDNQIMINWGGMEKKLLTYATLKDLVESYRLAQYGLRPIVNPGAFKDKICILGTAESNAVTGKPSALKANYASSAACGIIVNSVLQKTFVHQMPGIINILIIILVAFIFSASLTSLPVLRVMMIVVICIALLSIASIYGLPKTAAVLVAVFLAVPIGFFFAGLHLFSGLLFTIFSVLCYLIASAGLFKLFNLAIVTFYPVFAIILIFIAFYCYIRLQGYLSTVRLFNLATKDGLTGLYNRRQLNLLLDSELNSAALHKTRKLSLIMCDIDNFKKLNDTHGHQAGDAILKEFAKIMKLKCRQSDIVARFGGEEFIIMLSGAGVEAALKVAESIRIAIADRKFTFKDQPYSTSLSMGLVELTTEKTKEELIEKADQALYRAKKDGKNRVCVSH